MSPRAEGENQSWIAKWLDAVQDGRSTMSQRSLNSIEANGGVEMAAREARKRGVHLVELTDDRGRKLVAASNHEFKTLC
jgi:hypothetical protein